VEDNEDAARTLAGLLELSGYEVEVALDGRRGVRAEPALRTTRLVALGGHARPEDRERALAADFDAHLPKPPPLGALAALLAAGPRDPRTA
jgi:hypothetical protein